MSTFPGQNDLTGHIPLPQGTRWETQPGVTFPVTDQVPTTVFDLMKKGK